MSIMAMESIRAVRRGEGSVEARHGGVAVRREGDEFVIYKSLNSEAFRISAIEASNIVKCLMDLGLSR